MPPSFRAFAMFPAICLVTLAPLTQGVAAARPAAEQKVTLTFEKPLKRDLRFIAVERVYYCEGSSCVGRIEDRRNLLQVCRAMRRQFGVVAKAQVSDELMSAEELARCNSR